MNDEIYKRLNNDEKYESLLNEVWGNMSKAKNFTIYSDPGVAIEPEISRIKEFYDSSGIDLVNFDEFLEVVVADFARFMPK